MALWHHLRVFKSSQNGFQSITNKSANLFLNVCVALFFIIAHEVDVGPVKSLDQILLQVVPSVVRVTV